MSNRHIIRTTAIFLHEHLVSLTTLDENNDYFMVTIGIFMGKIEQ